MAAVHDGEGFLGPAARDCVRSVHFAELRTLLGGLYPGPCGCGCESGLIIFFMCLFLSPRLGRDVHRLPVDFRRLHGRDRVWDGILLAVSIIFQYFKIYLKETKANPGVLSLDGHVETVRTWIWGLDCIYRDVNC